MVERKIWVFDTTLRDGEQVPGAKLNLYEKVEVAKQLKKLQNMQALENIMTDDYTTFSGTALERWFSQRMMESCRYQRIGGWWKSGGKNSKGNSDDFEIDIVAETIEGEVEAYEVKRNAQKYNPNRLNEKVVEMQRHDFRGKNIQMQGLSMDDMERV